MSDVQVMPLPLYAKRILITSGPTSVSIDAMRVITNRSTGEIGRLIANAFAAKGCRVTLLEGAVTTAIPLKEGIKALKFFFFDELAALLRSELAKQPAIVIHAAAVSDFRFKKIVKGKIDSGDKLTLELVPTRKLVNGIKQFAPAALLVGFKFETTLSRSVITSNKLFRVADCDLVVANAQTEKKYSAYLLNRTGVCSKRFSSKQGLVQALASLL